MVFRRVFLARSRICRGLGLSLLVELTSGTSVFGVYACPYRVADTGDLIANTGATLLGWLMAAALLPDPHLPRRPDLDRPSLTRRRLAFAENLLNVLLGGLGVATALALLGADITTTALWRPG